ncbi:zinc-dependent alcohol dehydrogenase family protein [Alicyclobacillus fodiniaquatilis]|uniref:Zinc-dependent alcohol dehydrogenase family protein n=1 Tax=Alicyclobacillus fodiniaquatilis TaxID=1661150 RepID=A0ABW4JIR7_9BACL
MPNERSMPCVIAPSTVIRYHKFGPPAAVLSVEACERPVPKAGEVVVRMIACPINPSDLIPIYGAYAHRIRLPAVPGYEGVGIVSDIGPGVCAAWLGKRVLPLRGEGTWQTFVCAPVQWIVEIPADIDDEAACQLYINPITAWVICKEILHIGRGDVVAINAAGSSIGRIFAQLSRFFGFHMIAITENRRHTDDLYAHGALQVIAVPSGRSAAEAVLQATGGRTITVAIDSVGGQDGASLIRSVRPGGTFVSIGSLAGKQVNWGRLCHEAGVKAKLFLLRHWIADVSVDTWHSTFKEVMRLLQTDRLKLPRAGTCFGLNEVKAAVIAAEARGRSGKIILTGSRGD